MSLPKLDANQVLRSSYDATNGGIKMINASSLVPSQYNEINLTYTGSDITSVVYKNNGTTVATLTLGYSGSNLVSIVKA